MEKAKGSAVLVEEIEGFVRKVIEELDPEPAHKRGQPRILPSMALWAGMLVCVVRGFSSQLELWRLLSGQGLWDYPRYGVSDDAVYKRLKNAKQETVQKVFEHVSMLLSQRLEKPIQKLASFALEVFVLDEMALDAVKKRLPSLRDSLGKVLPGNLRALFDVRRQLWSKVIFEENADQNEKVGARSMLEWIPKGSLILADLGYFAFAWFDELSQKGYFWVSRWRNKTSYSLIHTLYQSQGVLDAVIWLGAYRADQAAYAVRLIEFSYKGVVHRYLTNVLDPQMLSIQEIANLYARRWDIEMMFNLVKTHLKLHILWSSHTNVVVHQVFAVFTIAQVILALRSEIATRVKADVFEVSLDLLIRWFPRFAASGLDPIQTLVERGRQMRIIRPASRLKFHAPNPPPLHYSHLPPNTVLYRIPRYAGKVNRRVKS